MRKLLIALVTTLLAMLVASVNPAEAAGNPQDVGYSRPPAGGSYVSLVGCSTHGGAVTVPANATFVVFGGWGAESIGLVKDWLNASTNTVSVDSGPAVDMKPYFAGLTSRWAPGTEWADIFFFPVTELAPGESVHVAWYTATSRPVTDGVVPGKPSGPSAFTVNCTVTGAG